MISILSRLYDVFNFQNIAFSGLNKFYIIITCHCLCLQSQHDELEAKFFEERAALEAKYQKLYEPLYTEVCCLATLC